jgi:hypothetical protein
MSKITIRRGDSEIVIEDANFTFEQVKELAGVNGYGRGHSTVAPVASSSPIPLRPITAPDFDGFYAAVSDRGRVFVDTLKASPKGIDAYNLATMLEYQDPRQIGGLTGGGLAKIAKRFRIKLEDVYRTEITYPENKRTVTFYPGKWLLADVQQKPAV